MSPQVAVAVAQTIPSSPYPSSIRPSVISGADTRSTTNFTDTINMKGEDFGHLIFLAKPFDESIHSDIVELGPLPHSYDAQVEWPLGHVNRRGVVHDHDSAGPPHLVNAMSQQQERTEVLTQESLSQLDHGPRQDTPMARWRITLNDSGPFHGIDLVSRENSITWVTRMVNPLTDVIPLHDDAGSTTDSDDGHTVHSEESQSDQSTEPTSITSF